MLMMAKIVEKHRINCKRENTDLEVMSSFLSLKMGTQTHLLGIPPSFQKVLQNEFHECVCVCARVHTRVLSSAPLQTKDPKFLEKTVKSPST